MKIIELYEILNQKYSEDLRAPWDNDGLMICPDEHREISKILVSLDADMETVKYAVMHGIDLIVTHHPLIFKPLPALNLRDPIAKKALFLYQNGISLFSFHTRLDCAEGGVNDTLAALLNLQDVSPFEADGLPMGRVGFFENPMSGEELGLLLKEKTGCPSLFLTCKNKTVRKVALLGGAGGCFYKEALDLHADAYITGEVKHHEQIAAAEAGLCLVALGHFYSENPVCTTLKSVLTELCPDATVEIQEKYDVHAI